MSTVDIALVQTYLSNMQTALQTLDSSRNLDVSYVQSLLAHTQKLLAQPRLPLPFQLPMQFTVGVGHDPGIKRRGRPNEDFVLTATGCTLQSHETYGIFVVADGMGGHANGQQASCLAVETMIDAMLPSIRNEDVQGADLGDLLVEAVKTANRVIYERNQTQADQAVLSQMGTTVTAALVVGPHAFVANVGDSRTYLYRVGSGLRTITQDHSLVAEMVSSGSLAPEEIYTHPKRNQITRCLGTVPNVDVDLFHETLQDGDVLLLCSDGVWEMTRDHYIEEILASSWMSAELMAEHLIQLAIQGGGLDNIGLIVSQVQMNVTAMQTMLIRPYAAVS